MNKFKKILLAVVALYILFLLAGFLLPAQTIVSRSVEVDATKEHVFSLISDHKASRRWSPWAAMDPAMEVEFDGPPTGIGSKQIWRSDHPKVGHGSSVFTEYEPYERVATELSFDQGGGLAIIELNELDNGAIDVTWQFISEHNNIFERFIGFFFVDGLVGPDFELGLTRLKDLVEREPAISTKEISYYDSGTPLTGYIASPIGAEATNAPVVIIVHEWWGHNDYARERADQLAEMGYHAFAIDMYGEGKQASHPEDAKKFMMQVVSNAEVLHSRFESALDYIDKQQEFGHKPVAAIGYCFGGAVVLSMARSNKPLAGVVSFHGGLSGLAPIQPNANVPVLVLNGADDPFVKAEDIDAFEQEMNEASIDTIIVHYEGAKHSFTSERADAMGQRFGLPLEYNEAADAASWREMRGFLADIFDREIEL